MKDRDHLNRPVVVVTGIGVLTALGEGLAENWRRLTAGEPGIRTISRFPLDGLKTTIAATVDFVGPPDQPAPDRMVEMAMRVGREAIAQAGLPAGTFPGPLVLAMAPFEMEWRQRLEIAANTGASPPTYADMIRMASSGGFSRLYKRSASAACRTELADAFGTQGSPIALTTACASGATALQIGLETIRRGETGAALIVGTDASITQETLIRFSLLQALSTRNAQPQSALRPFNKDRDGFVMGEGAGALVLESVAHAAARGATILGVLEGGGERADFVSPHPFVAGGQADHRLHAGRHCRRGARPRTTSAMSTRTAPERRKTTRWSGLASARRSASARARYRSPPTSR